MQCYEYQALRLSLKRKISVRMTSRQFDELALAETLDACEIDSIRQLSDMDAAATKKLWDSAVVSTSSKTHRAA